MTYEQLGDGANVAAIVVIAIIIVVALFMMKDNSDPPGPYQTPTQFYGPDYPADLR